MIVRIHAGEVLSDGRVRASFFWPKLWGPLPVGCRVVVEQIKTADGRPDMPLENEYETPTEGHGGDDG